MELAIQRKIRDAVVKYQGIDNYIVVNDQASEDVVYAAQDSGLEIKTIAEFEALLIGAGFKKRGGIYSQHANWFLRNLAEAVLRVAATAKITSWSETFAVVPKAPEIQQWLLRQFKNQGVDIESIHELENVLFVSGFVLNSGLNDPMGTSYVRAK